MPKHVWDNVTIDGFRGLRNLHLKELGGFNILVGANNSGKTSVLEAWSILCNPSDPSEWVSMVRRRDPGGLDETLVQSLRWCFAQGGQLADPEAMFEGECTMSCQGSIAREPYQIQVTYKDIVGYPAAIENDHQGRSPKPEGERVGEEEFGDIQPRRGAQITVHFSNRLPVTMNPIWEDQPVVVGPRLRPPLPRHETITPYSYQLNMLQSHYLSKSIFDPEKRAILDLVRGFDPDVEDIAFASFRGTRPAIYLQHRRLGPAPLSVFGEGFRRVVFLASVLPSLKTLEGGGILFIDDIDTGIYIRALKRVFSWFVKAARDLDIQIVATSHSLEVVDAIALAAEDQGRLDDLVLFGLKRTEQETQVKRIYGELLLGIRKDGLDVR
jgi:hypothetical protein